MSIPIFPPKRADTFSCPQSRSMHRRTTEELLSILNSSEHLPQTLEELSDDFTAPPFTQLLAQYMAQQQLNAAKLSELCLMSRSFTYQLCDGRRAPSRDIVLRLALVLRLSVQDAQRFLCSAQRGMLYPRVRRDAVLIFALKEHLDMTDADDLLTASGELPLL